MAETPKHRSEPRAGAFVSEPASGKPLPLMGYGVLKGQYSVTPGIDLTRPIFSQAVRLAGSGRSRKPSSGKR